MSYDVNMGNDNLGVIFDIQRFSLHDGWGIRDLVLVKGCPLRCVWCSNPESQNRFPEIAFSENRCIGPRECTRCLKACSTGAIRISEEGKVKIERGLCNNCGECAVICPAQAVRLLGKRMSVDDVMKVVEEDSAFYSRSGGGMTVGGGEPLAQAEFVSELLKECRKQGIDTAIETCGFARWEDVEKVCQWANLIFYDIKHMDSSKHKAFTGVGNELILENIKKLSRCFPNIPIVARTPVVPGCNDSEANIEATARFLSDVGSLKRYELLPYHGFGEPKYRQLGREYPLSGCKAPSQERMGMLNRIVEQGKNKSQ